MTPMLLSLVKPLYCWAGPLQDPQDQSYEVWLAMVPWKSSILVVYQPCIFLKGQGCLCTVTGCCLKWLYCWTLPPTDRQDHFWRWWSWCHHDGKSSIPTQEDLSTKTLAYSSILAYGGGNRFEAIVLLNSPSTGPTRPFLGGLTGNDNVKIVHPGCSPAMCLHARSWLCQYIDGRLFEAIVLLNRPYTGPKRRFLSMMIMVSPWWKIVHSYSRRPIYEDTCLRNFCPWNTNIL